MARGGQGMAEYCLIAALVLVATIGALILLGKNTSGIFGNMLANRPSATASVTATTSAAAGSAAAATSSTSATMAGTSAPTGNQQPFTVTLSDGTQLQLSTYPSDLKQAVSTVGANGTTQMLLDTLKSVISQLQADGKIDQNQASLLSNVANQGHQMADLEAVIENQVSSCSTISCYNSSTVSFQGQTYNPQDLVYKVAWSGAGIPEGDMTQSLRTQLTQAEAAGALNDPVAKQLVETLVNQIADIGNGLQTASSMLDPAQAQYTHVTVDPSQTLTMSTFSGSTASWLSEMDQATGQNTLQSLLDAPYSTPTNQKSTTICTVGSGTDTGSSCK